MPIVPEASTARDAALNARGYLRAHAGKLMIIDRAEGHPRSARDFFRVEDVGTHPTGLLVTGVFENERRGHMMATSVREANAAEIAWQSDEHRRAIETSLSTG